MGLWKWVSVVVSVQVHLKRGAGWGNSFDGSVCFKLSGTEAVAWIPVARNALRMHRNIFAFPRIILTVRLVTVDRGDEMAIGDW